MSNRERALDLVRRDVARGDELPDPPDNLDFLDLPEAFQEMVADRFDQGTALTANLDNYAHCNYVDQVRAMRARRDKFANAQAAARAAQRVRERANKASLGEYLEKHRAENGGSAR